MDTWIKRGCHQEADLGNGKGGHALIAHAPYFVSVKKRILFKHVLALKFYNTSMAKFRLPVF